MEKYYCARLSDFGKRNRPNQAGKSRLVEIQYARKPPSFAVVYLTEGSVGQQKQQLALSTIDLNDRNTSSFQTIKQIDLDNHVEKSRIIDLDLAKSINLEKGTSEESYTDCILLTEDASLFAVSLIDESVKCLTSGYEQRSARLVEGKALACRLQVTKSEPDSILPPNCYIHLLSTRCHSFCRLSSSNKLEFIDRYVISNDQLSLSFVDICVVEVNPQVVMLMQSDNKVKLLNRNKCLTTIELNPSSHQRHLIIGSNSSLESLILTYSDLQIVAHSLQVTEEESNKQDQDPDGLLLREPSFELEKCWSIDLTAIESLGRWIVDEEEDEGICSLAPIWSTEQLEKEGSWPKFLAVFYKFHILIYSFEQQPVLPFSVVYDSSFLKVIPLENDSSTPNDLIDVKLAPKLIHNFKLTGTSSHDSLYNTLFLAAKIDIMQTRYFSELGILISLSSYGDILAFKFTSSKVVSVKETLYQQFVGDALTGCQLLSEEAERIRKKNELLLEDINKLEDEETSSFSNRKQLDTMDRLSRARIVHKEIGCLYNLDLSWSDLINVKSVMIIFPAKSYLFQPTGSAIDFVQLDNTQSELVKGTGKQGTDKAKVVSIIELSYSSSGAISQPFFLSDGQTDFIYIYFTLNNIQEDLSNSDCTGYHLTKIRVKPLMTYLSQSGSTYDQTNSKSPNVLKIVGKFTKDTAYKWMTNCINLPENGYQTQLYSSLTNCSLVCDIGDDQIVVSSDDSLALAIIRSSLLSEATNESIELEVLHHPPSTLNLRHLLGGQLKNLQLPIKSLPAVSAEPLVDCATEGLFEYLAGEINLEGLSDYNLENSLRKDIEELVSIQKDTQVSEEVIVFREIISQRIIALVVNHQVSNGSRTSKELIESIRSRIEQLNIGETHGNQYVDEILTIMNK